MLASSRLSVRLAAWNNSAHTGWIFVKVYIWALFRNPSRNSRFVKIWQKWAVWVKCFLEWHVSDRSCREKHFLCSITFFFSPENRAVYEIMWRNVVESRQATDDRIIRRMRLACWVTKATNTYSQCILLLFHGNSGCTNAPQYYVLRMLPVLLVYISNLRCKLEIHATCIVRHCYQSRDSCVKRNSLSVELCSVRFKQVLLTVSRENWNVVSPAVLMLLMISH
jgi:hypothetical protein